jgi:hypothetical protein
MMLRYACFSDQTRCTSTALHAVQHRRNASLDHQRAASHYAFPSFCQLTQHYSGKRYRRRTADLRGFVSVRGSDLYHGIIMSP